MSIFPIPCLTPSGIFGDISNLLLVTLFDFLFHGVKNSVPLSYEGTGQNSFIKNWKHSRFHSIGFKLAQSEFPSVNWKQDIVIKNPGKWLGSAMSTFKNNSVWKSTSFKLNKYSNSRRGNKGI